MSDSSPHAEPTAPPPICEICGCSLIGITSIHNRCSPCFWSRAKNGDPSDWKAPNVKTCIRQNCPFDVVNGFYFCPAHMLQEDKIKALKFDEGKLPLDLLPFEALEEITLVLQHGALKYSRNNWRAGFIHSRPFSAILRHLFAYWKGEDLDKDSGLHHLAHAGCELLFLLSFVKTKTGVDDRYKEEPQHEPSTGN